TPINMATKKSKEKRKMKSANSKLSVLRFQVHSNLEWTHDKKWNLERHKNHVSLSIEYPTGDARQKAVEEHQESQKSSTVDEPCDINNKA
ncbi:hypothetical protein HHI36_004528, partial [Cryptolaemus montrouzieri]